MSKQKQESASFKALSELYLFHELYQFVRQSTGLAITCAYIILLLSSMFYIFIFYAEFDINIVKYVSFEDILATPIKNPNIILAFFVILTVLFLTDIGNRFRARQQLKYEGKKMPLFIKAISFVVWAPRRRTANLKTTSFFVVFSLIAYIYFFATNEATNIRSGESAKIELTLADKNEKTTTALLGTSVNYVFTYDHIAQKSVVYYVESVKSIANHAPVSEVAEEMVKPSAKVPAEHEK